MKSLIFIHGPNGVGKSTVCEALHRGLDNSAWLESEWARRINPFRLDDEIAKLTEKNMTSVLRNYLETESVEYVIFNWGFHNGRKKVFDKVIKNLSDLDFKYKPITLNCDREENIKRMRLDGRSEQRIERSLLVRSIYDSLEFPSIDITYLDKDEIVDRIIEMVIE